MVTPQSVWVRALLLALCSSSACTSPSAPDGGDADPPDAATPDAATPDAATPLRVALFTKTTGFRHASIEDGKSMLQDLARRRGWTLAMTEDAAELVVQLGRTDVVVFLSTTGDILGPSEQSALEQYVRAGGGWVGVHAAADCEYDWPFYGELVGAWFRSHPNIQPATLRIEDRAHPSTRDLPDPWPRTDEWYDFRTNPRARVRVLVQIDEASYQGGVTGADHPMVWSHETLGGRAFYTALGHTEASYSEAAFIAHVEHAIAWAGRRE